MKTLAIVVNYNSGELLEQCVRALGRSTLTIETRVVDNNSTDASLDPVRRIAQQDDTLSIVENPHNLGFATANNQILDHESADYYVLVNPDCMVQSETIARIVHAMENDPAIGLASCTIRNADGSIQKTCRRRFPTPWSALMRSLGLSRLFGKREWAADFDVGGAGARGGTQYVEAISGALMVVGRKGLTQVGSLDEGYFMHCEDLDWCMRFWRAGYKVASVTDAEAVHYKGGSGRNIAVNWHLHRGMLRFYSKHYRDRYPLPLLWLVYLGVGLRFLAVACVGAVRGVLSPRATRIA